MGHFSARKEKGELLVQERIYIHAMQVRVHS